MSPKRKIPSRKLPSRKFSSKPSSGTKEPANSTTPASRPPIKPKPKSSFSRKSDAKPSSRPRPDSQSTAADSRPPTVAACYWDMGFESAPTLEELRQRYKELSLVLHPDAGGNKEAFLALRANYETAQALLQGISPPK